MQFRHWIAATFSAVIFGLAAQAAIGQSAGPPAGVVDQPCPPPLRPPPMPKNMDMSGPPPPEIAAFLKAQEERSRTDWGNLCRYRPDNAALAGKAAPKVVFIGDSITEGWAGQRSAYFSSNNYAGRGISGQVSGQNLARFRADVVALKPQAVHILIGTNDVAGNGGPTTLENIENNIASMADIAQANGIKVVIGTVTPATGFPWRRDLKPGTAIQDLNTRIRAFAARRGFTVADYYPVLATPEGAFKPTLSGDGVHPNPAGFEVMEGVAQPAIQKALAARN